MALTHQIILRQTKNQKMMLMLMRSQMVWIRIITVFTTFCESIVLINILLTCWNIIWCILNLKLNGLCYKCNKPCDADMCKLVTAIIFQIWRWFLLIFESIRPIDFITVFWYQNIFSKILFILCKKMVVWIQKTSSTALCWFSTNFTSFQSPAYLSWKLN